ncbi:PadR family transcriptional regulator [Gracilibacillus oryzae]|uniref:PadR family transcriptional regulator n=1 Tax=Gracilibacillus oryzae TaxID=1672701 RepID=A0A7C8GUL4_9BACI|nr:helix-turn-helix transcriptional regulator [Gracilibacillus oryzae]KAB8137603.1 PadR family transcriptional regulator [Gracilibacillus oryzae]
MNKEMLKGTIDLLILSLLNTEDNYGYQISKKIKEKTEGTFVIQEGTLYLSLKRLENNGAITSYWGEESQGGRRKYYGITEEGKEQLDQNKNDWKNVVQVVNRFI